MAESDQNPIYQDERELLHDEAGPVEVIVEPWGSSYEVPPGETWRFVARSSVPGEIEIAYAETAVVLFAWGGCTFEIFQDERLIESKPDPAPHPPPGKSMRELLEILFGMTPEKGEE